MRCIVFVVALALSLTPASAKDELANVKSVAIISAIGDCALYASPRFGGSLRLESVQNATDHARCVAARNVRRSTASTRPSAIRSRAHWRRASR